MNASGGCARWLCAAALCLATLPAVAGADQLTDEEFELLDDDGKISFSYGGAGETTTEVRIEKIREGEPPNRRVRYRKTTTITSRDGDVDTDVTVVSNPDPWVGYHLAVHNPRSTPLEFDAFPVMPMLPVTGGPGAPPQVMARVDVTLTDTGGAAGASLEPLFFPNMLETFVNETETGGLTDGNAGLGASPITATGTTSLSVGPRAGPNPADDPTVDGWNYLTPFVNVRLSPGDTVEIIGMFSMVEQGQPQPDPAAVFAEVRAAVPEPAGAGAVMLLALLAGSAGVPGMRRPKRGVQDS